MLYFIFIVASTLRLDFVLPAFTGVVAAANLSIIFPRPCPELCPDRGLAR
jgi:hypothetical protein